jgi:hypothetical protein
MPKAHNPPAAVDQAGEVALLDQAAEAALGKAAEARAAASQARLEEHQRREQAQREYDLRLVAGFSRRQLDADVALARHALDAHLADSPLVAAFADWLHAEYRRRDAVVELVSTLARLGRPADGGAIPPPPWFNSADIYITAAVERIAADRADADRAELATQRENAATATTIKETT